MKDLLQQADRIPVTLVVAIAYVTMFALTNLQTPDDEIVAALAEHGWLTPQLAASGEPWRLLTYAFVHGGLLHIGFNTFALLAIGPALETALGSVRFALVYAVAALGGGIAVCVTNQPFQPVVGGSGALFGMMGALLAKNMRSGRHLFSFLEFEGPRRLVGLIVVNLVIGMVLPFISNAGHVGGLIAGFCLLFFWLDPGREPTPTLKRYRVALTALGCGLLFWSIAPAARYDTLWNGAVGDGSAHGDAMRRAAVMDYVEKLEIGAIDEAAFRTRFLK
ncbi:MAG: rhomboid family intramembrane serine protease [Planctomycetes bacterium]|nr:rhomboid family intramembrane serine protease [Planctomycetota bacterium]